VSSNNLRSALNAADTARQAYVSRCLDVWHQLRQIDPELAADILAVGFDERAAALWICQPDQNGDTPAAMVDANRSEDVRMIIRRTAHGFGA